MDPIALPIALASPAAPHGAASSEHLVVTFIAQVALMLLVGRLMGELAHRVGQPAVVGQLLAGIVLGPSVLGAFWPAAHQLVFPDVPEQKRMLDAMSQFGVLMLLLMAGMETDLGLVGRMRRTALFSSLAGILFPFGAGLALGLRLPAAVLPDPAARIATAAFLAVCLSVSSLKIVAMVIMEVQYTRRNIGQMILATAVVDDTIGWILVGMISGFVSQGTLSVTSLSVMIAGTAAFLGLSLTVGRRAVAYVIRWTNDHFRIEFPVITAILVLMCAMALTTQAIGVHTTLGAFVAGILVGRSPILTRHIQEELQTPIVALFAPIFFAVAGLSIDLRILREGRLLELAMLFVVIASAGKLAGGFLGGRVGSLSNREALALAIGMNARGSTEVIVATIGLGLGVFSRDIFTLVVITAIVTTVAAPPLLRWALRRVPPSGEEKERLDREAAEAKEFVPNVERILVVTDDSPDGKMASTLAGLFAGSRQVMSTVLSLGSRPSDGGGAGDSQSAERVKRSAEVGSRVSETEGEKAAVLTEQVGDEDPATAVLREAEKGFEMLFLGTASPAGAGTSAPFSHATERIVTEFRGTAAIVLSQEGVQEFTPSALNILVATTGTDYAHRAVEVAVAIAKGAGRAVTVLHVARPPQGLRSWRLRGEVHRTARALLLDIAELARREGVPFRSILRIRRDADAEIVRQLESGKHNLLVVGVKVRQGDGLFFGDTVRSILAAIRCPVLLVKS